MFFPPDIVTKVKAIACELPKSLGIPLSRFSRRDLHREVMKQGIAESISDRTIWRWLSEDAIRPWSHRSWISVRDPDFARKGGRILDLYHRTWEHKQLGPNDYVISADEKTSIQARGREVAGLPQTGRLRRVESDYARGGALAYIAAWDVHQAKVFGVCREKTGIKPFNDLVDLVMQQEPYKSAKRVFWVVDNGSSHRGQTSIARIAKRYPNTILVHTPVHASWLNQIEIYFSIVQRKVLTPNEYNNLKEVEKALMDFQVYYEEIVKPFEWLFTRKDLLHVLKKTGGNMRISA